MRSWKNVRAHPPTDPVGQQIDLLAIGLAYTTCNTVCVRIGIVPPLELVTCSHVFSPQLPLNQTCKLSSPNSLYIGQAKWPTGWLVKQQAVIHLMRAYRVALFSVYAGNLQGFLGDLLGC
jgi:hypothetical protein